MSLHREHQHGPRRAGVRLALKDQLELQQIVRRGIRGPDFYKDDWSYTEWARIAVNILQRHGVEVHLDSHSGQVTFNPEVITA